jgi:hypothetical protein
MAAHEGAGAGQGLLDLPTEVPAVERDGKLGGDPGTSRPGAEVAHGLTTAVLQATEDAQALEVPAPPSRGLRSGTGSSGTPRGPCPAGGGPGRRALQGMRRSIASELGGDT